MRASTPPGAAGRVFGFVYSGLDLGSLATPVFYGWMLDHHLPQAVFYTVFGFTALAALTIVLLVPVRDLLPVEEAAVAPASPYGARDGPRASIASTPCSPLDRT